MEQAVSAYVSSLPTPPDNDFETSTWLGFLLRAFSGRLEADEPKPRGQLRPADCTMAVGTFLSRIRPLVMVEEGEALYVADTPHLYRRVRPLELQTWVRDLWLRHLQILGSFSPRLLEDAATACKVMVGRRVKTVSRRYLAVGEGVFWDTRLGRLTGEPEEPVFFRLFDTDKSTKHVVTVAPFTPEQLDTLKVEYQRALDLLRTTHDLPEDFQFVRGWADGAHGVYMDIMRAAAAPFMRKKPMGAFMPIGLKRNGKSVFAIGLMKTMLGANNCSAVRLSELGDYHYTRALQWTLYNAPDEEDEKPTQYASDFKTLADHGTLMKQQMRSQEPITVDCDFVCCFPMNHEPEWTGSGAAACVQRSLIIPFTHDFSAEDATSDNFAEMTYTAEMFARLLGHLFALATYHLTEPLVFSQQMATRQASLTEDTDSHVLYRDHFLAFFDGFQSLSLLYDDYQYWCQAQEYRFVSRKVFKMAFMDFLAKPATTFRDKKGVAMRCYRVPQVGKMQFVERQEIIVGYSATRAPVIRTVRELHASQPPLSAVERCEMVLELDFGRDQLEKEIKKAKRNMNFLTEPDAPPPESTQPTLDEEGLFQL